MNKWILQKQILWFNWTGCDASITIETAKQERNGWKMFDQTTRKWLKLTIYYLDRLLGMNVKSERNKDQNLCFTLKLHKIKIICFFYLTFWKWIFLLQLQFCHIAKQLTITQQNIMITKNRGVHIAATSFSGKGKHKVSLTYKITT